jgi:polar amino acid transport system substrate-binding protein
MFQRSRATLLFAGLLAVSACTSGSGVTTPPSAAATTAASPAASTAPTAAPSATPMAGGLLDKVLKAGTLKVSTDPKYPPQSELDTATGEYKGFDIDVANEIGKRLGVKVKYETPDWTAITAGGWGGRWDMSVGSMTITPDRAQHLDFSPPYYYTPAQMTASKVSGITSIEGLVGKTVCAGEGTTYDQWLNGTLDFGPAGKPAPPPAGIKTTTLPTDTDCPDTWKAGRNDFQGWLSSITTVQGAIDAGLPVVKIGDPVYLEPLGVAVDKSGPNDTDFMAFLAKTIQDMHADGTLKTFSQKWFKTDYTVDPNASPAPSPS